MQVKISPSQLEQWRLVRLGMYNKTDQDMEDYILGDFVPNEDVSQGSATHEMIEHGPEKYEVAPGKYEVYEPELKMKWEFDDTLAMPIRNLRKEKPSMVFESWHTTHFELGKYQVKMNMRYDGLDGLHAHEFKTSGRRKQYMDYYDTLQNRAYLYALPELQSLTYHVFSFLKSGVVYQTFEYPQINREYLEAQLKAELMGLLQWAEARPKVLETLSYQFKMPLNEQR